MSEGDDVIDEFNSEVNCDAHTLAGSRTIRASERAEKGSVVQLRFCITCDGISWCQITRADQAWADFMTENELLSGIYLWDADPGTAKDKKKTDSYAAWITESLAQRHGIGCDRWSARD